VVCHIIGRRLAERESAGNEIWAEEGGGNRQQEEIAGSLSVCVKWPEREADSSPVYIVNI
jgi:hypothetical protein